MTYVQRLSAAAAGLGLLVMAILAGYANLGIIEHAAQSTPRQLDFAAVAMGIVALLDVLVAAGTWGLFRDDARRSTAVSAALRCIYAVLLAAAAYRLATCAGDGPARARAFQSVFAPAMGIFGLHLVALAWPVAATRFAGPLARRALAAAVGICGVGYSVDAVSPWLLARPTRIGTVTFFGEIALMIWLLVLAARGHRGTARG